MNWHLTIKNNETGETVKELDICSFIGAVGTEDGSCALAMTNCNGMKLTETLISAENALQSVYDQSPIAKHMVDLAKAAKALTDDEDKTENENN